jgi:hypothetical protein
MYCTWELIDTDHIPQTTDHGHTLNLSYYLIIRSRQICNTKIYQLSFPLISVDNTNKIPTNTNQNTIPGMQLSIYAEHQHKLFI